jgi:hypothetical protein
MVTAGAMLAGWGAVEAWFAGGLFRPLEPSRRAEGTWWWTSGEPGLRLRGR